MIYRELCPVEIVCEVSNRYWVDRMKSKYMQLKFKHLAEYSKSRIVRRR